MCAVGGILSKQLELEFSQLAVMSMALTHRGPDDADEFRDAGFGLFHRLLRIHSPLTRAGPYQSNDGRWILSFNGEIYNHAQMKTELDSEHKRPWALHTDAEVLLEGWADHGENILKRLNGMYAFALWDRLERKLILARDRVGEKPLYYTTFNNRFYFASEIKAFKAAGIPLHLNKEALAEYLNYRYVSGDRTMFANIKKLNPGSILTIDHRLTPTITRYWSPRLNAGITHATDERLSDLLESSCRLRLSGLSHSPALFLSGGVDSTGLASYMPTESTAYTFRSPLTIDETREAATVAHQFSLRHQIVEACEDDNLKSTIWATEEPLGDSIQIPTLALARAVKASGSRVVISGEGADELFAGYAHHFTFHHIMAIQKRFGTFGIKISKQLLNHAPFWALENIFPYTAQLPRESRARLINALININDNRGLGSSLTRLMSKEIEDNSYRLCEEHNIRDVRDLLILDMETWLPSYTLCRMDKILMSQSLEGRLPYLDPRIVDWANSKPAQNFIRGRQRKYPLRQALAPRIGSRLGWKKKMPFIFDTSKQSKSNEYVFQSDLVKDLAHQYTKNMGNSGTRDFLNGKRLFALRVLDAWLKVFEVSH